MSHALTAIKKLEKFYGFPLNKAISLLFFNLAALSTLLIFSGENFTNDTYYIYATSIDLHFSNFICSYRFFGAFLYYLLSLTGYSPIPDCTLDVFFFIILTSVILTFTFITFYNYIKAKSFITILVLDIAILISVVNVWFCNILSFPECVFITAVGLFLCFIAINLYTSSLSVKSNRLSITLKILSSITLILATGVYQQFMVMFFVYTMVLCCIQIINSENQNVTNLLKPFIKLSTIILPSFIIYISLAIGTQKVMNIRPSERIVVTPEDIISKIIFFIKEQHTYLKGRYYFKSEIMTFAYIFLFLMILTVVLSLIFKENQLSKALIILTSTAITYFAIFIPGIISTADGVRPLFPMYSLFFVATILTLVFFADKKIFLIVSIVLLLVLSFNIQKINECESNLKKINSEDAAWAECILIEIEEYENANNCEISSIAICADTNPVGNSYKYSYTESSLRISYSRESLLKLKSPDKTFIFKSTPDEVFNKYFANKDWNCFKPSEQIIFINNTAYVCCY